MTPGSNSRFGNILSNFCTEEMLCIADLQLLNDDTFTFVSSAHNTCSWLDHVVTTADGMNIISSVNICKEFVSSDHLPVCLSIDISCTHVSEGNIEEGGGKIDWSRLDSKEIASFTELTRNKLSEIELDFSLLTCNDAQCCNSAHIDAIDSMYNGIIRSLDLASDCIKNGKSKRYKVIPGWNE